MKATYAASAFFVSALRIYLMRKASTEPHPRGCGLSLVPMAIHRDQPELQWSHHPEVVEAELGIPLSGARRAATRFSGWYRWIKQGGLIFSLLSAISLARMKIKWNSDPNKNSPWKFQELHLGSVAERSIAADCESANLGDWVTRVRIPPLPHPARRIAF